MTSKILIIGQALPAVKQQYPYDTTLWYDWLSEIGISKEQAQEMFEFEAMTDKFPGHGKSGHLKPSMDEMDRHYRDKLGWKILLADKIILLGNVPRDYFEGRGLMKSVAAQKLCLIHPSRRNYDRYMQNKEEIISSLKQFIYK